MFVNHQHAESRLKKPWISATKISTKVQNQNNTVINFDFSFGSVSSRLSMVTQQDPVKKLVEMVATAIRPPRSVDDGVLLGTLTKKMGGSINGGNLWRLNDD